MGWMAAARSSHAAHYCSQHKCLLPSNQAVILILACEPPQPSCHNQHRPRSVWIRVLVPWCNCRLQERKGRMLFSRQVAQMHELAVARG